MDHPTPPWDEEPTRRGRRAAPRARAAAVALTLTLHAAACGHGDAPDPAPAAPPGAPAAAQPLDGPGFEPGARLADPPTAVRATHDELLADRAAPRHSSDGGGRAWIEEGPAEVVAGGRARWRLQFEVGPEGIAEGGGLYFLGQPFWGWSPPQVDDPRAPGLVIVRSLATEPGLDLTVASPLPGLVLATVRGRALAPGERVELDYGAGPAEAIVDRYADRGARLWFAVDGDGDGVRSIVRDSPTVDVVAGEARRLVVTLPSVVAPGGEALGRVALLDAAGNAAASFTGPVALLVEGPAELLGETPGVLVLGAEDRGRGTFRLRLAEGSDGALVTVLAGARSEASAEDLVGTSDPLLASATVPRPLWADLHGHSGRSDGTGTPADFYAYAREVAGLDAAALTDHDHWGVEFLDDHEDLWAEIVAAAGEADAPGEFTSLVAFEWTSWLHGHRHVLHFDADGPLVSSIDPATDDPDELWAALRGRPSLTFAHHSAGGPVATNWTFPPDPVLEPITEIVSVHGSSEAWDSPGRIYAPRRGNFVRDALAADYRLGFIGSGDGHDGHPGLARLNATSGGLAAILATENTRPALLEALRARRTWATTGERILVHATLAGEPIGALLPAAELADGARLELTVVGTEPLTRVEVVRRGREPAGLTLGPEGAAPSAVLQGAREVAGLAAGDWLYLRVVQRGGGVAWTSPFFVE